MSTVGFLRRLVMEQLDGKCAGILGGRPGHPDEPAGRIRIDNREAVGRGEVRDRVHILGGRAVPRSELRTG